MNKTFLLVEMFVLSMGALGCLYKTDYPFDGYYSKDGKIAVEYPRNNSCAKDLDDGKWHTPVIVHYRERGEDVRVVTNMCRFADVGSCGNYALESKDGHMRLEDYSYGNSGDPDAIYTCIVFRINPTGKEKIVPLERFKPVSTVECR